MKNINPCDLFLSAPIETAVLHRPMKQTSYWGKRGKGERTSPAPHVAQGQALQPAAAANAAPGNGRSLTTSTGWPRGLI